MPQYGVIFDMDGVLVDSFQAHFESWNRMTARHGQKMTAQQFADTFGQTSREIIPMLWPECAGDEIDAWDAEKEADYRDILVENFPAMPGATKLLTNLAEAGYALGIGSSGPPENVEAVVNSLPAAEVISATVNGMEVVNGKPDPEVFIKVAEKLDVDPRHCAVIEDAPAGLKAARSAGMAAIALTGPAPRRELAEHAHVVVEALQELSPAAIGQLIDETAAQEEPAAQEQVD